jgi:hypothetical protein
MRLNRINSAILRTAVPVLLALASSTLSIAGDTSSITWKRLHTATSFTARAGFASAYDPVSKKIVLFGGLDSTGNPVRTLMEPMEQWLRATARATRRRGHISTREFVKLPYVRGSKVALNETRCGWYDN